MPFPVSFCWGSRTHVMAILNVTTDSFSGDGVLHRSDPVAAALMQARRAAADGADVLDIGGMSTRPGAPDIAVAEEIRRVVPVIESIAAAEMRMPISVDTFRAETAARAIDAGATIVNSIWGLRPPNSGSAGNDWNDELAATVAESGALLVLTHNRRATSGAGSFGGHYIRADYADFDNDVVAAVIAELSEQIAGAKSRGIGGERLILDPGLGFGKTPAQNITVLARLAELKVLGLPILLGASRKSFVGKMMQSDSGDAPTPEHRDSGTLATTVWGALHGADLVRVHEVAGNVGAARVADALRQRTTPLLDASLG